MVPCSQRVLLCAQRVREPYHALSAQWLAAMLLEGPAILSEGPTMLFEGPTMS